MNPQIKNRILVYVLVLVGTFHIRPALADDPDAMINVVCDQRYGELRIEETFEQMPFDTPYPRPITDKDSKFSMRALMWAEDDANGEVHWSRKNVERTCRIAGATYKAIFEGWKYNENPMGMCGGGTPTASITITRNGKPIVESVVFHGGCSPSRQIESMRLVERTREIELATTNQDGDDPQLIVKKMGTPISSASLMELLAVP